MPSVDKIYGGVCGGKGQKGITATMQTKMGTAPGVSREGEGEERVVDSEGEQEG